MNIANQTLRTPNFGRNLTLGHAGCNDLFNNGFPIHGKTISQKRSISNRQSDVDLHHTCDMSLGSNIKRRRIELGWKQKQLATKSGLSQTTISDIERGRNDSSTELPALAKALSLTVEELTKGSWESLALDTTLPAHAPSNDVIEIPSEEDYAFVPLYDVRASAGNGHPVEHELIKGTLAFQREWLRAKGLAVKNLSVIYAMGKSMEPRINDGDVLLIDASQRNIKDGKVYAIRWHGELRIKRLVRDYDGSVRIISDNKSPDYPEQHVPADALDQLEIIGRVVWMGGDL